TLSLFLAVAVRQQLWRASCQLIPRRGDQEAEGARARRLPDPSFQKGSPALMNTVSRQHRGTGMTGKHLALTLGAAGLGTWLAVRALRARAHFDLRGKVVLITGGSRGLGLVMARQMACQGARLAICARDKEELERAARELAG